MHWARQHQNFHVLIHGNTEEEVAEREAAKPVLVELGWLVIGLALVLFGSHVVYQSVELLCTRWGVPPAVVAVTVVAFGTSLPELATAFGSIVKGHKELLVGNIIGADVLNVLFVTGAAACATPLELDRTLFVFSMPVMLALLVLFRVVAFFSRDSFPRWTGIFFLALFLASSVGSYLLGAPGGH